MSGGGDVRVLRQDREEQPESPRMPAWKREILERRRAKGGGTGAQEGSPGGGGGGAAAGAAGPAGPAGPHRHNGSAAVVNGSKQDSGGGGGNGRNYTITTASQHFGNNKETRHTAAERATSREEDGEEESLVLQESLGPLEENPFIKLEKERRRRQDRENAARPVQHILELYGSVPGIRTIRAENIIIIESDPEFFPDGGGVNSAAKWQPNGVSTYSSLNDLLDRRGSAVTEIRAKEVVIYDTTISKSEENLSTLGRPDHELQGYDAQGEGQGRVSRMLQKFDSNYGKLQKKSHSTENLLDLDCSSASSRPRLWSPKPDAVPKPRFEPATPFLQTPTGAFKPKAEPESPQQTPNHSVYSFRQRFEDGRSPPKDETDSRPPKPTREREWDSTADPKPKVPCSPETRRARASESSPSNVLRSTPDFEIRPSPKPDLAGIPDNDAQARALANLRLQSKNSFTVIPKRRLATAGSPPAGPLKSSPSHRAVPTSPTATTNDFSKTTPIKSMLKSTANEPVKVAPTETSPAVTKPPSSPTKRSSSPTKPPSSPTKRSSSPTKRSSSPTKRSSSPTKRSSSPTKRSSSPTKLPSSPTKSPSSPTKPPSSPTKPPSSPTKPPSSPTKSPSSPTKPVAKPVIVPAAFPETSDPKCDETRQSESPSPVPASPPPVASSPTLASPPPSPHVPHAPSATPPADHLPVTNIDDIEVGPPQRAPAPSPLGNRRKGNTFTVVPKRRAETDSPQTLPGSPEVQPDAGPPGSTPPQAPYSQLGTLLKKRYPAAEEIEVIGGYLSLAKSCLTKTGSTGKKLKISFNEASLQSTYEYPSETSAWDSEDEEEEEERGRTGKDSPEEQPSMVGRIHIPRAGLGGSPMHPNNANDLSNYIPKHSVDYNTWQEQRHQEVALREESPQPALTEEVMLTPADSSSLSDFSSEPALYF